MSQEFPRTLTNKIALVLWVIFVSNFSSSIFSVLGFISTNTGFKLDWTIGHNDVDQHSVGIIISSSFFNLFFLYGLIRHCKASRFADDPELTISEYFDFNFAVNFFSKFLVSFDNVSCLDFKTLIPLMISSSEKGFSING